MFPYPRIFVEKIISCSFRIFAKGFTKNLAIFHLITIWILSETFSGIENVFCHNFRQILYSTTAASTATESTAAASGVWNGKPMHASMSVK